MVTVALAPAAIGPSRHTKSPSSSIPQVPCDGVTEMMSAFEGGTSDSATPAASCGPLFVTVVVNVTARCTNTAAPDASTSTARSDRFKTTTSVASENWLLEVSGSSVVDATFTELTMVPDAAGATTWRSMQAASNSRSVPRVHVTVLDHGSDE